MGEDGARSKDWLSARGHHLCLTDTIFYFFFRGGGGGGRGGRERQGNMAIYVKGLMENNSLF